MIPGALPGMVSDGPGDDSDFPAAVTSREAAEDGVI